MSYTEGNFSSFVQPHTLGAELTQQGIRHERPYRERDNDKKALGKFFHIAEEKIQKACLM